MRHLTWVFALGLLGSPAQAYDSRVGDQLTELRLGLADQSLSFGQFLTPSIPVSVVVGYGQKAGFVSMRLGYERHFQSLAILPRASFELGADYSLGSGVGTLASLRGGGVWYLTRALGVAMDVRLYHRVVGTGIGMGLSALFRF